LKQYKYFFFKRQGKNHKRLFGWLTQEKLAEKMLIFSVIEIFRMWFFKGSHKIYFKNVISSNPVPAFLSFRIFPHNENHHLPAFVPHRPSKLTKT